MRGYSAFLKKEITENMRNFRLLILLTLFLVFGLVSPLTAKFNQEIIAIFAPDMQITFTESTALDAWEQFYKNISGMGFSALIILFGSCLSNEYAKGTLIIMLTKGLSRPAVIFSKFSAAVLIMTLCFWAGFALAYGYTAILWQGVSLPHAFFAALALWMTGLLYLSILIFGCVLFQQTFTSILFTGGVVMVLSVLSMLKQVADYSPMILTTKNLQLLSGKTDISSFLIPTIITIGMAAGFLYAAVAVFDKKQL